MAIYTMGLASIPQVKDVAHKYLLRSFARQYVNQRSVPIPEETSRLPCTGVQLERARI